MNKKTLDEIMIEYRITLNQKLYEEKVIDYEVFRKMEDFLIKKLYKLKQENRTFVINNTL